MRALALLRSIASIALAATLIAGVGRTAAQGLTGVQANWHDLETWSHYLEDTKQSELGLGLQPGGPAGSMLIAFLGRLSTRTPQAAASEVRIQVAANALSNPNLIRRATLTFLADAATDDRTPFDLSSRLIVDDPTPGGNVQNGIATMSPADFVRLGQSKTLTGNIFGFDVVFAREQIVAMKMFADTLHLTSARR